LFEEGRGALRGKAVRREIVIQIPPWKEFKEGIERDLTVFRGISKAKFHKRSTSVDLPEVLIEEYQRVAKSLGYSFGEVISFLALLGAAHVEEDISKIASLRQLHRRMEH